MPDLSRRVVYTLPDMECVRVQRGLVYHRAGERALTMNVYAPPDVRDGARLPIVLFVHGGPIPAEMQPPTEWGVYQSYGELMAASGMVGVTFNHRFHGRENFDDSLDDVRAALTFVRAHADEFHADADHMAVWAFSGGGIQFAWLLRERRSFVRCMIAYYAVLDLRSMLPPDSDDAIRQRAEQFSATALVRAHAGDLPLFVARAGQDRPALNEGIDRFVQEALVTWRINSATK